jgi:double-stranded uracil-DNA glycosylase
VTRRRAALSHGFPPVLGRRPRILILGSLPGRRSLEEQQYYAQPQNAFWKIMGRLVGAGPELDYERRLARLRAASIALWDVVAAGERKGSLDSAIVKDTIVVNDFAALLSANSSIEQVCFNGQAAAALYRRQVMPRLDDRAGALPQTALPSTSPAYASMPFQEKLARWTRVLDWLTEPAQNRNV